MKAMEGLKNVRAFKGLVFVIKLSSQAEAGTSSMPDLDVWNSTVNTEKAELSSFCPCPDHCGSAETTFLSLVSALSPPCRSQLPVLDTCPSWCACRHGAKNTVLAVRWHAGGHLLLAGSRDQVIRLYDVRTLREVAVFRGHAKEVTALAWHPTHHTLFASAAHDGNIRFWYTR